MICRELARCGDEFAMPGLNWYHANGQFSAEEKQAKMTWFRRKHELARPGKLS
jgi:hypothetical protein